MRMLVPTVQQVDTIIAKVRQLDRQIDEIHSGLVDDAVTGRPVPIWDAVESLYDDERGADNDWPPIEWFVRKLGGRDVPLDRKPEDAQEARAALILAGGNTERIMRYLTERLPELSDTKLHVLREEELTPLLKDMLTGADGVRDQAPLDLSTAIEKQIEENWHLAEEYCRRTYIAPLIDEVERTLLPIRKFIRAVTCCKPDENPLVAELVRRADHGALRDAIAELEKIKYGARIIEAKRQVTSAEHSADFHSVRWYGTDYTFTHQQAAVVKLLWEAWESGTPNLGQAYLLEKSGSETDRLRNVFKGTDGMHLAWNTMIIESKKGVYRLHEP